MKIQSKPSNLPRFGGVILHYSNHRSRVATLELSPKCLLNLLSAFDFKEGDYVDNTSTSNIRVVDVSHLKIPLYVPQNIVSYLSRNMDVLVHQDMKQDLEPGMKPEPVLAKKYRLLPVSTVRLAQSTRKLLY